MLNNLHNKDILNAHKQAPYHLNIGKALHDKVLGIFK